MRYKGQTVLVLGLGVSGRAAAHYLLRRGARVIGVDQKRDLLATNLEVAELGRLGLVFRADSEPVEFRSIDFVVVSPGMSPEHSIYSEAVKRNIEVIGEMELACRGLTQPCVAITGSNGKTTTTLLVEHALRFNGIPAKALGNIGTPLTKVLDDGMGADEVAVLELSSWQLETMHSRVIDAGAILNITPNHLDRHGTMEVYARAKINLKNCLKTGGSLFVGAEIARELRELFGDFKPCTFGYESGNDIYCDRQSILIGGQAEFELPEKYRGKVYHDVQNMMAAFALCKKLGLNGQQFAQSLSSFKTPPHRIEFVQNIGGVAYYDDSKGTNLDAVAKAVSSLTGPIYLIAGGMHKGAAYTPWIKEFAQKVVCVCAIGQAAPLIHTDIGHAVPVEIFPTLEAAVSYAADNAKEGDNVLLSPGCSSYDMFKGYDHRGDEFKRIVHALSRPIKKDE